MKKLLRLMAVALVTLTGLCACNDDEPYLDNPKEVAAKTEMIENAFKTIREQPWGQKAALKVSVVVNPGTAGAKTFTFALSDVRIEGDLIYFGKSLVLHVVNLLNCSFEFSESIEGHAIQKAVLNFILP